ncbi:hypothetical protein ACF3MZ_07500 [Paenibacillaceae bacterium WGS1546]|uniref:hypothetical protein n=1 Tax=Cohnella sp. WGS1546 TaxID=3366810 RepID=UPI00372D0151
MDDKELFEQLKSGPLPENGFNDALRRRINENLDRPRRSAGRPAWMRWTGAVAIALVLVVLISGIWAWRSSPEDLAENLPVPSPDTSASEPATNKPEINPIPHSAVVIGLRKDEAQGDRSSYRTIMVAPENERLKLIGSGSGIWMPFKSHFWQLVAEEQGDGSQQFYAYRSGVRPKNLESAKSEAPDNGTEMLLYAGDRYVSILETTTVEMKNDQAEQSRVVVKTIEPENRTAGLNALVEENVPLARALELDDPRLLIDNWAIARENNEWVAKEAAQVYNGRIDADEIRDWPTVAVNLNNTKIAKDDPLALSWEEVQRLEPAAIDAYTSQDEDVALIVTRDRLKLVPYQLPEAEREELTVDISPDESIVMVQWAIQESYVQNWKAWFTKWFAPSAR